MNFKFVTRFTVYTSILFIFFTGISTFIFAVSSMDNYNTYDRTTNTTEKTSFQNNMLNTTEHTWFVITCIVLFVFSLFRWIWIINECNKWNRMLDAYIEFRAHTNNLSNYEESDLNKAYLDPDFSMFVNMNLWTHKQMKYCPFIHKDVIQYHNG